MGILSNLFRPATAEHVVEEIESVVPRAIEQEVKVRRLPTPSEPTIHNTPRSPLYQQKLTSEQITEKRAEEHFKHLIAEEEARNALEESVKRDVKTRLSTIAEDIFNGGPVETSLAEAKEGIQPAYHAYFDEFHDIAKDLTAETTDKINLLAGRSYTAATRQKHTEQLYSLVDSVSIKLSKFGNIKVAAKPGSVATKAEEAVDDLSLALSRHTSLGNRVDSESPEVLAKYAKRPADRKGVRNLDSSDLRSAEALYARVNANLNEIYGKYPLASDVDRLGLNRATAAKDRWTSAISSPYRDVTSGAMPVKVGDNLVNVTNPFKHNELVRLAGLVSEDFDADTGASVLDLMHGRLYAIADETDAGMFKGAKAGKVIYYDKEKPWTYQVLAKRQAEIEEKITQSTDRGGQIGNWDISDEPGMREVAPDARVGLSQEDLDFRKEFFAIHSTIKDAMAKVGRRFSPKDGSKNVAQYDGKVGGRQWFQYGADALLKLHDDALAELVGSGSFRKVRTEVPNQVIDGKFKSGGRVYGDTNTTFRERGQVGTEMEPAAAAYYLAVKDIIRHGSSTTPKIIDRFYTTADYNKINGIVQLARKQARSIQEVKDFATETESTFARLDEPNNGRSDRYAGVQQLDPLADITKEGVSKGGEQRLAKNAMGTDANFAAETPHDPNAVIDEDSFFEPQAAEAPDADGFELIVNDEGELAYDESAGGDIGMAIVHMFNEPSGTHEVAALARAEITLDKVLAETNILGGPVVNKIDEPRSLNPLDKPFVPLTEEQEVVEDFTRKAAVVQLFKQFSPELNPGMYDRYGEGIKSNLLRLNTVQDLSDYAHEVAEDGYVRFSSNEEFTDVTGIQVSKNVDPEVRDILFNAIDTLNADLKYAALQSLDSPFPDQRATALMARDKIYAVMDIYEMRLSGKHPRKIPGAKLAEDAEFDLPADFRNNWDWRAASPADFQDKFYNLVARKYGSLIRDIDLDFETELSSMLISMDSGPLARAIFRGMKSEQLSNRKLTVDTANAITQGVKKTILRRKSLDANVNIVKEDGKPVGGFMSPINEGPPKPVPGADLQYTPDGKAINLDTGEVI